MSEEKYFKDKLKFLSKGFQTGNNIKSETQDYLNTILPDRVKSKTNLFNTILNVIQDYTNVIFGNVSNAIRNSNIRTATQPMAIKGLAQLSGYNSVSPISSRGVVKIRQKASGLYNLGNKFKVDSNTILRSLNNNLLYYVDTNLPFYFDAGTNSFYINLIEGIRKTQRFIADGSALYTIHLNDSAFIENYELVVKVGGETWNKSDSLRDIVKGDKEYLTRNGITNQIDIVFGTESNGLILPKGTVIDVDYMTTNGEFGNLDLNSEFEFVSGVINIQNEDVNINEYVSVSVESGFSLGSNGENIETTRTMTGWNSRSNTFARPENLKSYLSRLSILSHIDIWTNSDDDRIFNILCLPKLNLSTELDYFLVDESKFYLSIETKTELKNMIINSKRQMVSDEFIFVNPVLKKYAMMIYIDSDSIFDVSEFKQRIKSLIANLMLQKTWYGNDMDLSNEVISKAMFIDGLYEENDINKVAINLISEENEQAKINKEYISVVEKNTNGIITKTNEIIKVPTGTNPNLGFSDIGDIKVKQNEIPIIRGGFKQYINENTTRDIKDVEIYLKQNGIWKEI